MELIQAASSDYFFFYDTVNVHNQISSDLMAGLVQSKGELFYDRDYGCDLPLYEGRPNTLTAAIMIPYAVVSFIGLRNTVISDGSGAGPDRRVAATQGQVTIVQQGVKLGVAMQYVELGDISAGLKTASAPLGGS